MARGIPKQLPICSATVEVLGSHWPQTAIAWAGFYWDKAVLRDTSTAMEYICRGVDVPPDHHLSVPWAHPNDGPWDDDCWYRVRPKNERYRFVRASNGNWILCLSTPPHASEAADG